MKTNTHFLGYLALVLGMRCFRQLCIKDNEPTRCWERSPLTPAPTPSTYSQPSVHHLPNNTNHSTRIDNPALKNPTNLASIQRMYNSNTYQTNASYSHTSATLKLLHFNTHHHNTKPHGFYLSFQRWTSYAVVHYIALLMMSILMPETCWVKEH
jgi:hypothetical protein